MKQRIITAGILLAVFLALILINARWLNFAVFALIFVLAFYESLKLWMLEDEGKKWLALALAFFALLPFTQTDEPFVSALKVSILAILCVASVVAFTKGPGLKIALPFIYPVTPIFLMWAVYDDLGVFHFVWLIFIIVASDSGAYFIGRAFGKTPLSASSPNKTVEGVLGGLALALIVSFLYARIFTNMPPLEILSKTIVIVIFSVLGDLFESYLKRAAGLKDSGALFPGHGGILDRIDGYMFGAIAMAIVYSW